MSNTKTTIKTIAARALLATTIMSNANAADSGSKYLSLTGEYIVSAEANGALTASIGSANFKSDYSDGVGVLAAVGYQVNDNVRFEAEGGYHHLNGDTTSFTLSGTTYTIDSSNIDTKAITVMGNAYLDIPTQSKLSPYFGAGLGWAHETEDGGNAIAYQLMAGVNYNVSNRSTLFAGYKYLGTGDFDYKYNITGLGIVTQKSNFDAHALNVGCRFNF